MSIDNNEQSFFIVYDKVTMQVKRSGSCPLYMVPAQTLNETEAVMVADNMYDPNEIEIAFGKIVKK